MWQTLITSITTKAKRVFFWILLLLQFFFLCACGEQLHKPKKLLSKAKMSDVMADMALYDNAVLVAPEEKMENVTMYILLKNKIKEKDFQDSYSYYLAEGSIDAIYDDVQKKILQMDPNIKKYIIKRAGDPNQMPTEH